MQWWLGPPDEPGVYLTRMSLTKPCKQRMWNKWDGSKWLASWTDPVGAAEQTAVSLYQRYCWAVDPLIEKHFVYAIREDEKILLPARPGMRVGM